MKNRFLSNSGWMMAQQIYAMAVSLVLGILTARYLGPSNYGLINYGNDLISFFSVVCQLGFGSIIINEMINEPKKSGSYLGTALLYRVGASVMACLAISVLVRVLRPDSIELYSVTGILSISVVIQSYEVLNYWFQQKLLMKYITISTSVATTIVAIWRVYLLASNKSVTFFAMSNSIQYFACGIIVLIIFHKIKDIKLSVNIRDGNYLLTKSYHYIISGLAATIYTHIDSIMVGRLFSDYDVGIYHVAIALSGMLQFVPMAFIQSATPIIIKNRKTDYKKYEELLALLLLGITLISIILAVFFNLFGELAIRICYGEAYLDAVPALLILSWSMVFAMIGSARSIWTVAEGYNFVAKYYIIIGAVVNLALNAIVIPKFGYNGAAVTTLISQFVVAFVAPMFFKKTRRFVYFYISTIKNCPEYIKKGIKYLGKKN